MRTDRVMRIGFLAVFVAAGFGSTGCEHMNNTEKGVGLGAATGAGLGLLAGAATGNPRTGAAVGGLVGAGLGGAVGNAADREERRERDFQQAVATAQVQAQQQRMGMTDVVYMAQAGHDDQVIINQIRTTGSTFQLTGSDLDFLKNNGVSGRVIAEMQAARPATRVVSPRSTVIYETPAPVIVRPAPVYMYGPPPPRPVMVVGGCYHWR
jgi:hypothetical protein